MALVPSGKGAATPQVLQQPPGSVEAGFPTAPEMVLYLAEHRIVAVCLSGCSMAHLPTRRVLLTCKVHCIMLNALL